MASAVLLFLLMMTSHVLVFAASQTPVQGVKEGFNYILQHREEIRQMVTPFLELLSITDPKVKFAVNAIVLLATGKTPEDKVLKTLVDEFQSLNVKLDNNHMEQKWDSWASGAYHKPEIDIEVAWTKFQTLLGSLDELRDEATWKRHRDDFITSYQEYEPATKILRMLMKTTDTSFINNLGLMLAEHVKCDQDEINEYAAFITMLILKGTWLNEVYYHWKNINSQARIDEAAKIQHDVASAIFQMQKFCISQIMVYVEKDLMNLIDKNEDRSELAKHIRESLEKKDTKYEWMVVAYKTTNSGHDIVKIRNKHTLTGFTVVTKQGVSVAVARQVKGKHTKADKIKQAIKTCSGKFPACYKVEEKLRKCKETVDLVPLSLTYTAVHAFHGSAHESHTEAKSDINRNPDTISVYENVNPDTISLYENVEYDLSNEYSETLPNTNLYTGECWLFTLRDLFKGKFYVMIKSDEEIEKKPCSQLDCGTEERGQCVTAGSPSIAMCECKYPYYGKNCEKKI